MEGGTRLGQYEIIAPLGAGGMGEVYRARDSRLARDVAIKVLPAALADDPERLARLEREAQLLAALEHPNVAAVYGLEESGGVRFLVMQLAAGTTLADRLEPGPLPLDETLEIAGQIADGLEAAHERGIVHRDLKPANVMVAPGGEVKILDFGLAKALGGDAAAGAAATDLTASPTVFGATAAGVILGTAAYMSPEQARGKPLDRRTDIWSYGCVLYEMLTGARAFDGETATDVMAAIVTRDPDWSRLPATTPAWLHSLLGRCLEKNPRQRLRDAGEARVLIGLGDDAAVPERPEAAPAEAKPDLRGWAAAALATMVAIAAGWMAWSTGPAASSEPSYVALAEPGIEIAEQRDDVHVAVSPDGRAVAIASGLGASPRIFVRRLDETAAVPLPGDLSGVNLAWNPDGTQLAFSDSDNTGTLRVFDFRTGAAATRYRAEGTLSAPGWTTSGELIVVERGGEERRVLSVPASGDPVVLARLPDTLDTPLWVGHLNGGRLLASAWSQEHGHVDTMTFDPSTEDWEALLHLDAGVLFAEPDVLLFARDGALWAQRLDLDSGTLRGNPVALITEIDTGPAVTPWLSVGGDTISYRTGTGSASPTTLDWVDRAGELIERVAEPDNYYDPRIAPDGSGIAYDRSDQGDAGDIWFLGQDGLPTRLTSAVADETRPVWSPDGSSILLETVVADRPGSLFLRRIDDPSPDLIDLGAAPSVRQPTDWAGDTIVANDLALRDLWIVDATSGDSKPYRTTGFAELGGALAPDGSYVAYISDETGRPEIWVESFPEPGDRRRVSVAGGSQPMWRRDGREILYLDPEGFITSVQVTSLQPLRLEAPTPLFQTRLRQHEIRQFDVSADGERILLNREVERPNRPIRLLLGWRQELARRAGPDW